MDDLKALWRSQDEDDEECGECGNSSRGGDSVVRQLLKQRTVFLTGEINQRSADSIKAQLILLGEQDAKKAIRLFINSPGGDADAGYSIYDTIRFIQPPVQTIGTGLVASAAVMVLLGARKGGRFAMPNTRVLIHQPSTALRGSASDIQIEATEIVKLRERVNKLIADETGQPLDKVANDTRRNCWLSAEEATEYGLIDKIINSRSEL